MSTDRSDVEGTQRMIRDLYELFEKKTGIIINKVPFESFSGLLQKGNSIKLATYQLPIIGVLPCSCDILAAGGKCLFASEKPNHPFTKTLKKIAANLAMTSYSAHASPKPLKTEKMHYSFYVNTSEEDIVAAKLGFR